MLVIYVFEKCFLLVFFMCVLRFHIRFSFVCGNSFCTMRLLHRNENGNDRKLIDGCGWILPSPNANVDFSFNPVNRASQKKTKKHTHTINGPYWCGELVWCTNVHLCLGVNIRHTPKNANVNVNANKIESENENGKYKRSANNWE